MMDAATAASPCASQGPDSFRDRFALTQYEEGGVLLDLESGCFYRLNALAARISADLSCGGTVPEVAGRLAKRLRVSPAEALQDVQGMLAQLSGDPASAAGNPISFDARPGGLVMHWEGEPVLQIDREGRKLKHLAHAGQSESESAAQLMWVVPHLLTLQHQPVLHASAVRQGDGVLAFCGCSGIGKSTLAAILEAEGMSLVSDDLVLVSLDGGTPQVIVAGEAAVRRWVARESAVLAARGEIRIGDWSEVAVGPRLPLRGVFFLQRAAASGSILATELLAKVDALVLMLGNSFAEVGQREVWSEVLETSRRIVAAVPIGRALVPEGLEALRDAVANYRRSVTP